MTLPSYLSPAMLQRVAPALLVALLLSACAHRRPAADLLPTLPVTTESFTLAAPGIAPAPLRVRVWLPPGYAADASRRYPALYLNDGQDMEAVGLQATLERLYAGNTIRPLIVVAIDMPPDRLGAYGYSDRSAGRSLVAATRHGPVGGNAHAYSQWVVQTLVPEMDRRYRTRPSPDARAMLGWSLGAANAFSLGWQYPEVFGRVGAFSPSFWLPASGDAQGAQSTRLAQQIVDASQPRNGARFFFAIGTAEENDDRDGDGVFDALDDARDLLLGWKDGAKIRAKGLQQLGYSTNPDYGAHPDRKDAVLFLLEGGEHNQASWARMLPTFLTWAYAYRAPALTATGRVDSYQDVESAHVPARHVDVWLPPGYAGHPHRRYPVVYMHDGQNLFDPQLSYAGVDWGVDEAMTRLIAERHVREAIVVGIWNTPRRLQEYMPRKPVRGEFLPVGVDGFPPLARADIASDGYLRFLVEELKPFIDARYRTKPGREDTLIMGSSMGGLISLYAAAEYPDVFGGVGAVSTHWPIGEGVVIDWLSSHLPDPRGHRIYYDFGTATLDAQYAPYQQRMDAAMRANGYSEGRNWITRKFEGAEHSERAWRERVEVPLEFLLGK